MKLDKAGWEDALAAVHGGTNALVLSVNDMLDALDDATAAIRAARRQIEERAWASMHHGIPLSMTEAARYSGSSSSLSTSSYSSPPRFGSASTCFSVGSPRLSGQTTGRVLVLTETASATTVNNV